MKNTIIATLLILLGLCTPTLVQSASAKNSPRENYAYVPHWMTNICQSEDDVNCWWDGGSHNSYAGEAFIREMPGRTHMVCVFFIHRPKRDYCS